LKLRYRLVACRLGSDEIRAGVPLIQPGENLSRRHLPAWRDQERCHTTTHLREDRL
jgi:hypothetical protein